MVRIPAPRRGSCVSIGDCVRLCRHVRAGQRFGCRIGEGSQHASTRDPSRRTWTCPASSAIRASAAAQAQAGTDSWRPTPPETLASLQGRPRDHQARRRAVKRAPYRFFDESMHCVLRIGALQYQKAAYHEKKLYAEMPIFCPRRKLRPGPQACSDGVDSEQKAPVKENDRERCQDPGQIQQREALWRGDGLGW